METFWQRMPKVSNFSSFSADQSFTDLLPTTSSGSFRGNRQLQKQRKFPKLASDSSSCSSGTTGKDQSTFDLGRRSLKQSTGTPMKKLLAQEMSKENEPRRRPPSVIARLMGLDGLPPDQSGNKQQKRTGGGSAKVQKGGTFYSRRSSRKSSKEEQEFKDVFEVLDASKVETGGYSSQGTASSKFSDAEIAFIQQKFMEAKRLSTDEKLQDSVEFNDALEVLDSNTDLLLKFLQQPDSLFTKHLHDLQEAQPQSHCGRISTIKSSHTLNHEHGLLCQRAGRETQWKRHNKSPQGNQEEILSRTYERYTALNSPKSPKVLLEKKTRPPIVPTRIVVLKPNIGKSHNSTRTASSPCSSHHFPSDISRHSEILGIEIGEAEIWSKKKVQLDTGFSRNNSRESREMAKEITRQMKNSFSNGSIKFSTSRCRGYAGDESSCDISGSESANESDANTVSSRDNVGSNRQHRRLSSHSSESSVSREAKKRLSERWKLTHGSQEVHMVSRGSTLGEMLAISDKEARPANSRGNSGIEGCSEFGHHVAPAVWNEPLGISSRDGWKDGCLGNLSRSRSLPASSTDFGSPRISTRHESLCRDKYVIPKDGFKWDKSKAVKSSFNQREAPLASERRSRSKKSQIPSSCSSNKHNSDTCPEFHTTPCKVKQNLEGDNQSEHNLMVSGASASTAINTSSALKNAADANDQSKVVPSEPSQIELSPSASLNGDMSPAHLYKFRSEEPSEGPSKQATSHCTISEPESQASSKEAEQPSPVSVIEAPFTDDLSSGSECFESISADLHGLRMQLQLLKLESESYEEGTMLLSSDDEADEASVECAEDNRMPRAGENWESVYIVDVLIDSGINGADPDTFFATWHSPECPLNPLVFEELEEKYCNLNSCSRAERKLIFDRINSKLLEIHQQYADQHPWLKSATKTIAKWNIAELEDSLCKSLITQNNKLHMDAGEMVLGGESQWLDLREDLDEIGREMERLLVDELLAEVMTMQ